MKFGVLQFKKTIRIIDTEKLSSFKKIANFHALDLGFFAQKRPSHQEKTNYDNRT